MRIIYFREKVTKILILLVQKKKMMKMKMNKIMKVLLDW